MKPKSMRPICLPMSQVRLLQLYTKRSPSPESSAINVWEELVQDLTACQETLIGARGEKGARREEQTPLGVSPLERPDNQEDIRQRRVRRDQESAGEARQRAVQEAADTWATALFEHGLARERAGQASFQEHDYPAAQSAYQDAVALFDQAHDQAREEAQGKRRRQEQARQLAHQAQQEMQAAKTTAEGYGARERARKLYTHGLQLREQADELWDAKEYEPATQRYTEARVYFADAETLAQGELQAPELQAQDDEHTLHEAIQELGRHTQAVQPGRQTVQDTTPRQTAPLPSSAGAGQDEQQDQQSEIEAEAQRQLSHTTQLRQQAEHLQQAGEQFGDAQDTPTLHYVDSLFQRACGMYRRGEEQLSAGHIERAYELLLEAGDLFTEVLQTAQPEQTGTHHRMPPIVTGTGGHEQEAATARAEAQAAQREVLAQFGDTLFPTEFQAAVSLLETTEQTFHQGDFETVQADFVRCTARFQELLGLVETQRQQRQLVQPTQQNEQGEQAEKDETNLDEQTGTRRTLSRVVSKILERRKNG